MREDVPQALAIDAFSTIEDRIIDITTMGRRSGQLRRIEIVFYRPSDDIYLSGVPGPKTRDWLANLAAHLQFTFHLEQHGVAADLSATATVVVDPAARRRALTVFVEEINRRRRGPARTARGHRPSSTNGWNAARWRGGSRSRSCRARRVRPRSPGPCPALLMRRR